MGLGRHLLGHGEAMIAAAGHTDFQLHARVENLAAIAFYENAGWSVTDGVIHTVEHGISYDERILVKRAEPIAQVPDSGAVPAFGVTLGEDGNGVDVGDAAQGDWRDGARRPSRP